MERKQERSEKEEVIEIRMTATRLEYKITFKKTNEQLVNNT